MESHNSVSDEKTLKVALFITLIFFFLEVSGGYIFNSLALLGDAGHTLGDLIGLFMVLYAIRLCERLPTKMRTFGFHRSEVMAALVNGVLLILISIWIFIEGAYRLFSPEPVGSAGMLIIALIGLAPDLYIISKLRGSKDVNIKTEYVHILTDAFTSVAVVAAAIVIMFTGFVIIDTLVAFLISLFILFSSVPILREVVRILMQGTPPDIDLDSLIKELKKVKYVKDVHNVHVWSLCSHINVLDCHVHTSSCDLSKLEKIKEQLRDKAKKFNIMQTTFEFETNSCFLPAKHK